VTNSQTNNFTDSTLLCHYSYNLKGQSFSEFCCHYFATSADVKLIQNNLLTQTVLSKHIRSFSTKWKTTSSRQEPTSIIM